MILRILSVVEDVALLLAVVCFFAALSFGSLGEPELRSFAWAAFWCFTGAFVIATGALLKVGPGTIAKLIKARAAALAKQGEGK